MASACMVPDTPEMLVLSTENLYILENANF
jgi:hypothetical protein